MAVARTVERAKNKLVREYERLIHQEDLPLLEEVDRNPHLAGSDLLGRLLYNRLVLPYVNGENWLRVHPAVLESSTWKRRRRESRD